MSWWILGQRPTQVTPPQTRLVKSARVDVLVVRRCRRIPQGPVPASIAGANLRQQCRDLIQHGFRPGVDTVCTGPVDNNVREAKL